LRPGALRLHTLRRPLCVEDFIQPSQVAAGTSSPRLYAVLSHHTTRPLSSAMLHQTVLFSSPTLLKWQYFILLCLSQ
jgi:hypothetical protein